MTLCPSCGLDDHIVLDKHGTELLVECVWCRYSWTISENSTTNEQDRQ